jgi:hypothetical protein
VVRAIAELLSGALGDWLLSLLPGPEDEEELGYGAWLRKSDGQVISRFLDVRDLTEENQRRFHEAVVKANQKTNSESDPMLIKCLADLSDMVERANRGEPPLGRSDWTLVQPSSGLHLGPGW